MRQITARHVLTRHRQATASLATRSHGQAASTPSVDVAVCTHALKCAARPVNRQVSQLVLA
jgi:hypothetical protein